MRCTDMMPYRQLVSSTQSLPPPDLIQAYTGWPGDSCWGVDSVDSIDIYSRYCRYCRYSRCQDTNVYEAVPRGPPVPLVPVPEGGSVLLAARSDGDVASIATLLKPGTRHV